MEKRDKQEQTSLLANKKTVSPPDAMKYGTWYYNKARLT